MSWSPYKLWLPVAIAGDTDSGSLHPEHDLSESHLLLLERTEGKEGVGERTEGGVKINLSRNSLFSRLIVTTGSNTLQLSSLSFGLYLCFIIQLKSAVPLAVHNVHVPSGVYALADLWQARLKTKEGDYELTDDSSCQSSVFPIHNSRFSLSCTLHRWFDLWFDKL